jgi:hypothetical protein
VTTDEIALSLPVGKLELACIIDLIVNMCLGRAMTKLMIARLLELSERVFEIDIWNQDQFYLMLAAPKSFASNCIQRIFLTLDTFILYDEASLPSSAHSAEEANLRSSLHLEHSPRLLKV